MRLLQLYASLTLHITAHIARPEGHSGLPDTGWVAFSISCFEPRALFDCLRYGVLDARRSTMGWVTVASPTVSLVVNTTAVREAVVL